MLYDLNLPDVGESLVEKQFDVCIAGAGVAGITLALKLADAGKSILLLEGGGSEISKESQDLYKGRNIGLEYFDLETCRLRYLGGTSNHWGGLCRPLDAYDFEPKDHIPYSGWPIEKADLLPYEAEAYDILDIPEPCGPDIAFAHSQGMLDWIELAFSAPTRFKTKYGDDLERSANIHLVLNANVTDFKLDESLHRFREVACRSHAEVDRVHRFGADQFVLAMGGIENARALLNADSQIPGGIGNQYDLVGRFFADHPHFKVGMYWENEPAGKLRIVAPTLALMNRERIANCGLRLYGYRGDWPVDEFDFESMKNLAKNLACSLEVVQELVESVGKALDCQTFGRLGAAWEQIPNPASRVELSTERDKFGLRMTELDWQWTPMERKTIKVCALELGKAFARGDMGRVKIEDWVLDEGLPLPESAQRGGRHHIGTTRMSDSPKSGVVDKDCCVFGLDNFYVAGSSVFSTAGHANPTFTIVQLTLRLADHIQRSRA